jgi:hypothetical protein
LGALATIIFTKGKVPVVSCGASQNGMAVKMHAKLCARLIPIAAKDLLWPPEGEL